MIISNNFLVALRGHDGVNYGEDYDEICIKYFRIIYSILKIMGVDLIFHLFRLHERLHVHPQLPLPLLVLRELTDALSEPAGRT